MRLDDLFTILSWHPENTIDRLWIIIISAAISVFPPEKRLRYNVQDGERTHKESDDVAPFNPFQWIHKVLHLPQAV